jgi:hypothetical protein
VIGFDSPHNHDKIGDSGDYADVTIKLTVVSSQEIEFVKAYIDDKMVAETSSKYLSTTVASVAKGTHKLKGIVRLKNGDQKETEITIGVNQAWDLPAQAGSAPSPTPSASPTLSPSPSASL